MKYIFCFLLASIFALSSMGQSPVQLYPSQNSSEIQEAIDEAKQNGSTILLNEGVYILDKPIEIFNSSKGFVIKGVNPENTEIQSAIPLGGKIKHVEDTIVLNRVQSNIRKEIVEIDLAALGIHVPIFPDLMKERQNFPQLIYNDTLLPLSRYPNKGYLYMKKVIDNFGTNSRGGIFEYDDPEHARWANVLERGVWFTGYWRVPWQAWTVRIKDIDIEKKRVTHSVGIETQNGNDVGIYGGIGSKYNRPYGSGKENYYVENLLEEIDIEGEWCIDFMTQKLYLLPPANFDETLLSIISSKGPIIHIKNSDKIEIENISFKNHLDDGIVIEDAKQNLIAGCRFNNILGNAVIVRNGKYNTIKSNDFSHIGRTCIEVSGGNRKDLIACDHIIENNYFTCFGVIQQSYAPAVKLGQFTTGIGVEEGNAVGIVVRHNLVHNAPHAAFIYGGNNNILEYNEVFDIARVTGDVGAFYSRWDWTARGNVLRYNFVHHVPRANAFYADDGHAGDSIYNNVIHQAVSGTIIGGGHYNYICDNIYFNCSSAGISIDARGKQRNYNAQNPDFNHLFEVFQINEGHWDHIYPQMSRFLRTKHLELPIGNNIESNIFINCHLGLRKEGKLEDFRYSHFSNNEDLSLPDSIYEEMFQMKSLKCLQNLIPIEKYRLEECGLYIDNYRTQLPDREGLLNSIKKQKAGFDSIEDQKITNSNQQ